MITTTIEDDAAAFRASLKRRTLIILPLAALALATLMGLLAELPRIDWHTYVARSPLTIQTPSVSAFGLLGLIVTCVGVTAALTNRRSPRRG